MADAVVPDLLIRSRRRLRNLFVISCLPHCACLTSVAVWHLGLIINEQIVEWIMEMTKRLRGWLVERIVENGGGRDVSVA